MIKKVFASVLFLVLILIIPNRSYAVSEFASTYKVSYAVGDDGVTEVTENITLKNLTDRFYPSNFSLSIGATDIQELQASDSQGSLPTKVENLGKKSEIKVELSNQQVVGKDKEYKFSLKFKSKDFSSKFGQNWTVSVPKLTSIEDLVTYDLTLSVPVSFSDPSVINPQPFSQSEIGGRINFNYNKELLSQAGVIAIFGTEQPFYFNLKFDLKNDRFLPTVFMVPLPPNTPYQQVLINNIEPKPLNVVLDNDGNSIAYFNVERKSSKTASISGIAKVFISAQDKERALSEDDVKNLTSQQKFWEKDSPQIKNRVKEILASDDIKTERDKVKALDEFVYNLLEFDRARSTQTDLERLGALTSLANPKKASNLDFADTLVTFLRAAGIPSRVLIGYGASSSPDIRPNNLMGKNLHAWVEYYDKNLGFVNLDPTWQSTSGGVDYFTQFDLNHLVILRRGYSSLDPLEPSLVDVGFTEVEFNKNSKLNLSIEAPDEIFAGFPEIVKVKVENSGNSKTLPVDGLLTTAKINLGQLAQYIPQTSKKIKIDQKSNSDKEKLLKTGNLESYGNIEYQVNIVTGPAWQSYEDIISFRVGDQVIDKKVMVKPFFAHRYFGIGVVSTIGLMLLIYNLALILHFKVLKTHIKKK